MIHKLVYEPVFRTEILFYCCKNGKDVVVHAKKKYKIVVDTYSFDGNKGLCTELKCAESKIAIWLVWVNSNTDWKTMSHESAHLVFRILDNRKVKYDNGNDETWCYLHEYFISEFWHIMCDGRKRKK